MSTDKRTSQTTIAAGVFDEAEWHEDLPDAEPIETVQGIPLYGLGPKSRAALKRDLKISAERSAFDNLVAVAWQGTPSAGSRFLGAPWPFHVREAAGYAARWIAELERRVHDLEALLVEHDKAGELASAEMTRLIAANTQEKSRATAAFFHVFDKVREYGHAVTGLDDLLRIMGNVYTRKALLSHVESIRMLVHRLDAVPWPMGFKAAPGYGPLADNRAGPVVENSRLRRQNEQQQIEINRLNQRLAAIGFQPRKGKRK